jgi:hypothetical protein
VVADFERSNSEYLTNTDPVLSLTTAATWSTWIRPESLATNQGILTKWVYATDGDWGFQHDATTNYSGFIADAANDIGNNFVTWTLLTYIGDWQHFVWVYDGSLANANRLKLYLNGVLASGTTTGTIPTSLQNSATADLAVGNWSGTVNDRYYDGNIARPGIWNQAFDSARVLSLFNSGKGKSYADLTTAEKVGLVSYWNLNEASGNRADSHGSNTLTDNNTVGSATTAPANMPGTVANFVVASSQYFSLADSATTVWGEDGNGATCAVWKKLTTPTLYGPIFTRQSSAQGFNLYTETGSLITTLGETFVPGSVTRTITTVGGVWELVIMWYDPTDKKLRLSVNDAGEVASDAGTNAAITAATQEIRIGSWNHGQLGGNLSSLLVWNRVLTAGERTDLYNSGDGLFYGQ